MDLPRGFPDTEYKARVSRAQEMMARHDLAALFLTTEPDIRYFTGYLTKFWESPTRPWFLVLPASGDPVAVIPSIGAALMGRTWIKDIRTWRAPNYEDDGVSLLADTLAELAGGGNIGVPMGLESQLRMPLGDWMRLQAMSGLNWVEAGTSACRWGWRASCACRWVTGCACRRCRGCGSCLISASCGISGR